MLWKLTTLSLLLIFFPRQIFGSLSKKPQAPQKEKLSNKNHQHKVTLKKVEKDKITIKVKGMVCAFCAQGIKKNFEKRPEVKSTTVDLDKMEVIILLKEEKELTQATIKQIVSDAGFSYVGIKK